MMTREEYLRALARLVEAGHITLEEAQQLMAMFDAGEIDASMLPLPEAQALAVESDEETDRAMLLLLLALLARHGGTRVSRAERMRMRDDLRQGYMDQIAIQNVAMPNGVNAWHAQNRRAISSYIRRQAWAGSGSSDLGIDEAYVTERTREQMAYLYMYAMWASSRTLLDNPPSEAHLAHRNRLYQGVGWAMWFWTDETIATQSDYTVYRYVARDDPATCSPCSHENGRYYLPGQGPFPGDVCLGGGYCRCERVPVQDEAIWRQLTGG